MNCDLDLRSAAPADPDAQVLVSHLAGILRELAVECELDLEVETQANTLRLSFAGQERASAARIHQAWEEELAAVGIQGGAELHIPAGLEPSRHEDLEARLCHVLRRIRTLLIEHNSYLSGGIEYPFVETLPGVAARGLAMYRFPAAAEVDLHLGEDEVQIAFAPGPLGAVTSSGFYLPTLFAGDLQLTCEYQIELWRPCPEEAACFALFAQNEDSSRRYYAQRMSTGTQGHRLVASMAEQLLGDRPVQGQTGALRVERHGDQVRCAHREPGGSWEILGEAPAPAEREMLIGAKIWSKLRCDGLRVTVSRLRIEGQLAARQLPDLEARPDPRSDPAPDP